MLWLNSKVWLLTAKLACHLTLKLPSYQRQYNIEVVIAMKTNAM